MAHEHWKWKRGRRQVFTRDRTIHCYDICRIELGFTAQQARRFLKSTCTQSDLDDADRLYNSKGAAHAKRTA